MINIIIKDTDKQETLSIVDQKGIDYIKDFIGNYGAFNDGQFTYNDDKDVYICDQDTFDWWSKVVSDNQALKNRLAELRETFGSDAVQEVIDQASDVELEDLALSVNNALDEAFKPNLDNAKVWLEKEAADELDVEMEGDDLAIFTDNGKVTGLYCSSGKVSDLNMSISELESLVIRHDLTWEADVAAGN